MAVAGADQGQPSRLGAVGRERSAGHGGAQVVGQRPALAHGEDPGLLARMVDLAGHVAGGEDARVGQRAQAVVDLDEAVVIQREPGVPEPVGTAGVGHPHDLVGEVPAAVGGLQAARLDVDDLGGGMHLDAAASQGVAELRPHPRIVGGQDALAAGEKRQGKLRRVAPAGGQFPAQPVLHGQQQLDAAGAAAYHRDARPPRVRLDAPKQRLPAVVELVDWLDRYGMLGGPTERIHARGRADIDR